jgi:hypothetical protein
MGVLAQVSGGRQFLASCTRPANGHTTTVSPISVMLPILPSGMEHTSEQQKSGAPHDFDSALCPLGSFASD